MLNKEHPILQVENLKVWFPVRRKGVYYLFKKKEKEYVRAVDGVTFHINEGETFSIVGESGAGKTTLGLAIVGVYKPFQGKILFRGLDINNVDKKTAKSFRRKIQMIFQDPFESLPPHMTVFDIIGEGIDIHNLAHSPEEKMEMVTEALRNTGLIPPRDFFDKYPHQLSGGQRQRVSIAATLVLRPELIVADEPVSMIDASLRWEIIQLMMNLKNKYKLTYIFILHNLALARCISDRIAVMYLGEIVELGTANDVINKSKHPYTKALISVIPSLDEKISTRKKIILKGEIPNPINIPAGCRFHPRCPLASSICSKKRPELVEVKKGHYVRCLRYA